MVKEEFQSPLLTTYLEKARVTAGVKKKTSDTIQEKERKKRKSEEKKILRKKIVKVRQVV